MPSASSLLHTVSSKVNTLFPPCNVFIETCFSLLRRFFQNKILSIVPAVKLVSSKAAVLPLEVVVIIVQHQTAVTKCSKLVHLYPFRHLQYTIQWNRNCFLCSNISVQIPFGLVWDSYLHSIVSRRTWHLWTKDTLTSSCSLSKCFTFCPQQSYECFTNSLLSSHLDRHNLRVCSSVRSSTFTSWVVDRFIIIQHKQKKTQSRGYLNKTVYFHTFFCTLSLQNCM